MVGVPRRRDRWGVVKVPAFLAHLGTDGKGRPVPYVNVWGDAERVDRWTVRHDRVIHGRAMFYADTPSEGPNFFKQSPQRQRECMVRGLCQVCGRFVPWPDRVLVVSSVSTGRVDVGGYGMVVVSEPWLDPGCADVALNVCPALIRRRSVADLTLASVRSQRECELVVSTGWVDGPFEYVTRTWPAAMWVKVHLLAASVELVS